MRQGQQPGIQPSPRSSTSALPAPWGGLSWNNTMRSAKAMAPADHAIKGLPGREFGKTEQAQPIDQHGDVTAGDHHGGRIVEDGGDLVALALERRVGSRRVSSRSNACDGPQRSAAGTAGRDRGLPRWRIPLRFEQT